VVWRGSDRGIDPLSADARAVTSPTDFEVSLYKPENGLAANLFIGIHLNEYLTLQGNYIWNRNGLTLVSTRAGTGGIAISEQTRVSAQHATLRVAGGLDVRAGGSWLVRYTCSPSSAAWRDVNLDGLGPSCIATTSTRIGSVSSKSLTRTHGDCCTALAG
jgi:hypothetical protein